MKNLIRALLITAGIALASTTAIAAKDDAKPAGADKASSAAATSDKSGSSGASATGSKSSSGKSDAAAGGSKSGSAATGSSGRSDAAAGAGSKSSASSATSSGKSDSAKSGTSSKLLDLNTASEEELKALPQIGDVRAKEIIKNRPYARKDELVSKKILSQKQYDDIKDRIIARGGASSSSGASGGKAGSAGKPSDKK